MAKKTEPKKGNPGVTSKDFYSYYGAYNPLEKTDSSANTPKKSAPKKSATKKSAPKKREVQKKVESPATKGLYSTKPSASGSSPKKKDSVAVNKKTVKANKTRKKAEAVLSKAKSKGKMTEAKQAKLKRLRSRYEKQSK